MTTTRPETIGIQPDGALVEELAATLRGPVLRPDDSGYDDARRIWNGMIDKRPALIARCTGTADVVSAVTFARQSGLPLAVKGGGHNVAGNALCDDGLVIDLSLMRGIHVDPERRRARVQAGATWGDLDHETQLYGLMAPGGVVSSTGIAGFTLSGGMALSRRKWGLACDNLASVEVVTADGQVITASESSNPDLFWAVRGGGGNFGIVTSFEFQLHPLGPEFYVAAPIYALAEAGKVIRGWRRLMERAPDEITSDVIFWSMPAIHGVPSELVGTPIVIVAAWFTGPVAEAERVLAPMRMLGTPVWDLSHAAPYADIQSAFDPFFPNTQRYYWKSLFADALSDEVIDATIALAEEKPTPQTLFGLRALGGAMSRVPETATAYGNRAALYNLSIDTTWLDPADDRRMIDWTRAAWSRMHELTRGGVYLNFAGLGEDNAALARAGYGDNYARLAEIKRRYDPTNLFRGNINVPPAP